MKLWRRSLRVWKRVTEMKIATRRAKPKDARRVSLLICKTIDEINSKDYNRKQVEALKVKNNVAETKKKIKESIMLLAFIGKRLMGSVALRDKKIWGLYIRPNFSDKGIGKELMNQIEKVAGNEKIRKIEIYSTITAKEFYKKIGYKNMERFVAKVNGIPMKMFLMEKKLK